MTLYLLSDYAEVDLLEGYDYIDSRSRGAALRWERTILAAFDHLASYPATGVIRADIAPAPLRIWPVEQHIIVYNPDTEPVQIVALIHSARDIPAILQQRAGNHARDI